MSAATLWFTGLPCAGKTTLAKALCEELIRRGERVVVIDGDDVRQTLSKDLGFDEASRRENVRRCGAAAELITRFGVFAVVALISPSRAGRDEVRALHAARGLKFVEVYLSAPLSVCEARDTKGLYARGRAGLAKEVTGLDAPFEAPLSAEVVVPAEEGVEEAVARVLRSLP